MLIIGSGYLGLQLAEIAAQAEPVVVTTTSENKLTALNSKDNITAVVYNGYDVEKMIDILKDQTTVFICVAPSKKRLGGLTFTPQFYNEFSNTYDNVTRAVRDACKSLERDIKIIYMSAHTVYGNTGDIVTEEMPAQPRHKVAEIMIQAERNIMECPNHLIVRSGWIVKEVDKWIQFVKRMSSYITFPGNDNYIGNFVHIDDLLAGVQFLIDKDATGIYNLCNDAHPRWKLLFDLISETYDLDKIKWDPGLEDKWFEGNHRVSNDKIKAIGYKFLHPRHVGL